jgi:DNA invertase Pin-like site-specific DNA recombinase
MRIAAYCRVSTEKKEQQESLQHQKDFFTEYARRNGHELVRLYADEGITGTSLKKREEFRRLLRDAELGMFQMVVVKDISRFARNTVDALQSIRRLRACGVNILFVNSNMTSMGEGEFVVTVFFALAQEESHSLSGKVKWGKRINAEKGRVPPRIFGYDKVDNFTLAIHEGEAGTVRKIFDLYINQGLGCRTISMMLNRDGDKTKMGGEWNARGVRRILVNPLYCGMLVNHKYEIEDFLTGKQVMLPEEQWYFHERPEWAIVARATFQRAQEIMASRRKQYDSGEPFRDARYSSKHTFSTLIKCAHCGRSFTRKKYTYVNTRVYWRCVTNDQYTAERCDNHVILDEGELLEQIRQYFSQLIGDRDAFTAGVLAGLEKQIPAESNQEQTQRELETKRKRIQSKRERYQEMYANDLITMKELTQKLSSFSEELKALDRELEKSARSEQLRSDAEEHIRYYREEIDRFLELETVTNMDMRRLIDHISVSSDGNVQIILKKLEDMATT